MFCGRATRRVLDTRLSILAFPSGFNAVTVQICLYQAMLMGGISSRCDCFHTSGFWTCSNRIRSRVLGSRAELQAHSDKSPSSCADPLCDCRCSFSKTSMIFPSQTHIAQQLWAPKCSASVRSPPPDLSAYSNGLSG